MYCGHEAARVMSGQVVEAYPIAAIRLESILSRIPEKSALWVHQMLPEQFVGPPFQPFQETLKLDTFSRLLIFWYRRIERLEHTVSIASVQQR